MKKIYLSLLGFIMTLSIFAQGSVSGTVTDAATGDPLIGARIQVNGSNAATTNGNGRFTLPCGPNMELRVMYIGYVTHEEKIEGCGDALEIALTPSTEALTDVQLYGRKNGDMQRLDRPDAAVVLDKKELNRGKGLFLDDAINANVPGVTMNRRAVSSGQQFNIRGYGNGVGFRGANNNFDGQGYKVYLNNIPITDAEGVTLLDDIDFGSVGSVEVTKGPAGSLYGLAIAGAVNLTTVRPEPGQTSIGQQVLVGNYGLARFTTQLQMGGEKTSLLLNYGHQISDGFMDHNASKKDFVNAVLDFRPSDKQTINTYFAYSNSYDERGGELTIDQYKNRDYSGNARYIKNNAHSEVISFRVGLSHQYTFTDWLKNTTTIFGSGLSANNSSAGGWTDRAPLNYGLRSTVDLDFGFGEGFSLSGVAGVEYQAQRANIIGYRMVENPDDPEGYNIIGETRSNQFAKEHTSSLFTEWVLQMPYGLSLTAGVGVSGMNIDLEDRLYDPNSERARNVSADYTGLWAPHFAVNKIINNEISVYASYSSAYNTPVSGNIVLSTSGTLNTGLKPEQGNQFEIGSKGNLLQDRLHYQLVLFDLNFKDKFTQVAVPLDANTTAYTYIANGGKQHNQGVEALIKYTAYESASGFLSNVRPYANATYSHFRYKDYRYQSLNGDGGAVNVDYSGNAVAGVAPWTVNTGVDLETNPGFYGNVNYSYRGPVPFTSDGLNVADAYNLLNAKIGYRRTLGSFDVDLYAGATNITDVQYYNMVFINQLEDAYIPAPLHTNFFGGVNLRYNF